MVFVINNNPIERGWFIKKNVKEKIIIINKKIFCKIKFRK